MILQGTFSVLMDTACHNYSSSVNKVIDVLYKLENAGDIRELMELLLVE